MRVGLYGDRLARGPRATGVGSYIASLARALGAESQGHELVLFSTPERDSIPPAHYGELRVACLPWPRRPVQLAWSLLERPRVSTVDGGPLDLLHQLVPTVPVPTRTPLVVTIHDLSPLKFPAFFRRAERALFNRAVDHARRHAQRLIAISEATRRDVVELLGIPEERVAVVNYGTPEDLVVPSREVVAETLARRRLAGEPYVFFVGEITLRKNPLLLVDAFAQVSARDASCRLVLAGPLGLGAQDVVRRIEEHRLADRVDLLGRVARDELCSLVAGAACLVLPSVDEGFGLPALEAMSLGTPVVVSNGGSLPEVVGDAGLVFEQGDVDALAEAIELLLEESDLRRSLSAAGLARSSTFTWARAARETLAVYEEAHGN